jgi:type II secretory pathway component PulF
MSFYNYKAIDANGAVVSGMIEGDDISSVHDHVTSRGLYLLDASESSKIANQIAQYFKGYYIKRTDIIEFASNLSFMLRAGVPILTGLDDIITTTTNNHVKPLIQDIKKNVEGGVSFSDALSMHKAVIPNILIRLSAVGEETGRLDQSLAEVATHLQKVEDLVSAVKRALIYPMFAMVTAGGAVIFWLAYVLPMIMKLFLEMGVKMPPLTRALFVLSLYTGKYWYVMVVLPVLIVISIQMLKVRKQTRIYWDRAKLKLPIVKLIVYNKLLALFAEQLRLLISAGIPIDKCFEIVADVADNEVFKKAILKAREDIMSGSKISEALAAHDIFPPLVIRMAAIGETSGSLDDQFGFLASYYYKIVDDVSEKIGKMIEPLLLIVLGGVMGTMIAGVLLPIYDLVTKLK